MQTQPNPKEQAHTAGVTLSPQQTDQVGGGAITRWPPQGDGTVYFRDSNSGRIGVEDPRSGSCYWL